MTSAEQLLFEVISKVSDEDHDSGELEEAALEIDPPFAANEQGPSIAKPGEEPLDLLSMPLAALQPTLPTRCSFAIAPVRADQLTVRHHHSRCSFPFLAVPMQCPFLRSCRPESAVPNPARLSSRVRK